MADFKATMALVFAVSALALPAHAQDGKKATTYAGQGQYRTDVIDIPLKSGDEAGHWTEWKVRAKPGETFVYSWSVSGVSNPEEFFADFHGHTEKPRPEQEESYRKTSGLAAGGALVVPFEGIHGWYFKNDSAGPVTVHLRIAGYYDALTPAELEAHLKEGQ